MSVVPLSGGCTDENISYNNFSNNLKTIKTMKKFSWLMMLMAFVTLSLTGCKETPTPEPGPEPVPPTPETLTFEVEISEVTRSTMTFSVTPSDLEADYFVLVMDKATVEEYTKDEYLIGTLYDQLAAEAAKGGKTFAEYMAEYADKGAIVDASFSGLAMGTDYYLIVWGIDAANDFALNSEISKTPFTTEEAPSMDVTFEVTPSVYYNTVEFAVVPSDKQVQWHMMTLPKAQIENYTNPEGDYQWTMSYFYQMYMQNTLKQYLGAGYTVEQIIAAMFPSGDQTMQARGLEANTEYMYLIAAVLIENGEIFIVTEPASGTYTTEEALPSDMTFVIEVTDVDQTRAAIKITPSNDTERFFWIVEVWDGKSTAIELMEAQLAQWGPMMGMMANYSGVQDYTGGPGSSYKFKLDAPDTDYYVLVFGYEGGVTTAPVMKTFHTLPSDIGPYNVEFDMVAGGINPYGFTIGITTNDDTVYYTVDAIDPATWNEAEMVAMAEESIAYMYEETLKFNPNTTMAQFLGQYYWNGNQTLKVSGMMPNTEVMGYIMAFDHKTGKVSKVQTFNPLAKTCEVGSVQPTIELVGYYSGDDEAGAVFGQPDATAGRAICVLKYTGIEEAKATYTAILGGDASSEAAVSDPQFMSEFGNYWSESPLNASQPYTFTVLDWQTQYTAGAYSLDANGVMGKPGRLLVEATAENKSDIKELIDLTNELNGNSTRSLLSESLIYSIEPVKAGVVSKPAKREVVAATPAVVEMPRKQELPALKSNMLMQVDHIRTFHLRK